MQGGAGRLRAWRISHFSTSAAPPNIGDRVATPARWMDFGADVTVQAFGEMLPPCDVAVFGGGQVYGEAAGAVLYRAAAARRRVVWGVGHAGGEPRHRTA